MLKEIAHRVALMCLNSVSYGKCELRFSNPHWAAIVKFLSCLNLAKLELDRCVCGGMFLFGVVQKTKN